ncbi:MAG: hypothetical protein MRY63_02420 [Neomegalonema sp.]|nr:hypothetical protein [Neomegalonema sp.]
MTELSFAVAIAFSLDEASKSIEPVEAWAYMDSDSAPGDLEAELAEDVQHNAIEPATDMIGAAPALDPTMYEQALARFAEEQAEEDFDPDMPVQYNLDYT